MHSLMSCKEDIEILLMDVWTVVHEGIRTPDAGGCERNVEKTLAEDRRATAKYLGDFGRETSDQSFCLSLPVYSSC